MNDAEATREELLAEIGRLRHEVLHDPLTGLPNRALFGDRLERAVAASRRTGTSFTVLGLDLDGFKEINDRHGHAAGDALLRATGARLIATVRESDTVARLGGDEFAVVVFDADRSAAAIVAGKLRTALRKPIDVSGVRLACDVSVGSATFPDDGTDPEALLRRADRHMYAEKREHEPPGALRRFTQKLRRQTVGAG